uniref:Uncharacterized protein n=1 Tax=Kalanchoe fedtschenkoi TaxID=63787 RepID=A0A7N0UWV5_KALFE
MASSPKMSRTGFHARSVSLPSRPHPTVPEYDEILCRLQSSGAASSVSSVRNHLDGLQDLHDCVDGLMLLPETRHALARECHAKLTDEVLDGSLRLLDLCGAAKDSLLMTKECVQQLQSSLRRKGSDAKEAAKYLACRKAVKKLIQKALRNLKGLQTLNKEHDSFFTISMLREVEKATLSVLKSLLLSFVSGPKDQSLVSKLMYSQSSKSGTANEFEQTDAAVQSVVKHKAVGIDNIQAQLADLELTIEDLESGVECLHRHLIKTRVTLLNILST